MNISNKDIAAWPLCLSYTPRLIRSVQFSSYFIHIKRTRDRITGSMKAMAYTDIGIVTYLNPYIFALYIYYLLSADLVDISSLAQG